MDIASDEVPRIGKPLLERNSRLPVEHLAFLVSLFPLTMPRVQFDCATGAPISEKKNADGERFVGGNGCPR